MVPTFVLSICRMGKCSSRSLKLWMFNSLRNISPRWAEMPVRYSTGLFNMLLVALIRCFCKYISAAVTNCFIGACYPRVCCSNLRVPGWLVQKRVHRPAALPGVLEWFVWALLFLSVFLLNEIYAVLLHL